jgi:Cof subfamily protein (haloacid dehalogenase superfamily)
VTGFPYKLVATDLDGTLLRSDESVSARTREALHAVADRGAAHIVVTGRSVPWTRHILADLDYDGLAVCCQGAQIYHAGEQRLLTSVTLDRQLAGLAVAKVEAELGPLALAAALDGVDGEVLIGPGFRDRGGRLPARYVGETAELWTAPLSKLYIQHPELDDDELARAAKRLAGDMVGVLLSGPGIVEMVPLGLTKAKGLSLAARRLGAHASETIAFGDMPNDIPMFAWAAYGVAMADAHPELRSVADEVTASHDDDGVAVTLEKLLAR